MLKDSTKILNLALSGGGIKGIAYTGAFDAVEAQGFKWGNIAGVSAGALVGAYAAAGYNAKELRQMMDEFDFGKIELTKLKKRVPAIMSYMEFRQKYRGEVKDEAKVIDLFINSPIYNYSRDMDNMHGEYFGYRGSFFKNIITLSKQGCLCDGDYLEEWVYRTLARKGIRTFGDLKYGTIDSKNPSGYKVRMTAVDANRAKVIVLPDDISYYGIDPDKLEVSKAIRMSTCVPFAFKPVEIKKKYQGKTKTFNIVDGGVLDNFPSWLLDTEDIQDTFGFRLVGSEKNKLFSLDTPLNIIKGLITAVHDIGVEKEVPKLKYLGDINTGDISFLDFNLDENEKKYLYDSGKETANRLVFQFKNAREHGKGAIFSFLKGLGGKK